MLTWATSVMLWLAWTQPGPKSGVSGNVSMDWSPYIKRGSYHSTLHLDHDNDIINYKQGLDQANWNGIISMLRLLYVLKERC